MYDQFRARIAALPAHIYHPLGQVAVIQDPLLGRMMLQRLPTLICPSDAAGNEDPINHLYSFCALGGYGPNEGLALWYPASMGPIHHGICNPFCPEDKKSPYEPDTYCCQGWFYGTSFTPDVSKGQGNSTGMFGRYPLGFKFGSVTDGLSHTIMNGETLPKGCACHCAYGGNFPMADTATPLNIPSSEQQAISDLHITCGYKSMHPGGVNFVMGDASVQFFPTDIDYRLYNALGSRNGGEVAELP